VSNHFESKRRKKGSYLYYGIITAVIAAAMLMWGILSAVKGENVWSIIVSFIAAAVWGGTAAISFYVYRDANKAMLTSDSDDS